MNEDVQQKEDARKNLRSCSEKSITSTEAVKNRFKVGKLRGDYLTKHGLGQFFQKHTPPFPFIVEKLMSESKQKKNEKKTIRKKKGKSEGMGHTPLPHVLLKNGGKQKNKKKERKKRERRALHNTTL